MANLLAFFAVHAVLDGSAWNGRIEDGRHFLCERGRCVEVSAAVFGYSHWHGVSLIVTWPVFVVLLAVEAIRRRVAQGDAEKSGPGQA